MAVGAPTYEVAVERPTHRAGVGGVVARGAVAALLLGGLVVLGLIPGSTGANLGFYATTAAIYTLVGLSLNVILGYTGQLSLGHQGLVGAGALFTAYTYTSHGLPFPAAIAIGGVAGALFALVIGFVALRISGLYLALITLVFGITLANSLFELPALTGGGAGEQANRPGWLLGNGHFYLFCLAFVAVALYLDVRVTRSKAGRAFRAIKEDERVAAAMGINVVGYKLLAFVLSGAIAGIAGALYSFGTQEFVGSNFNFALALVFVVMTVVGGAGSRVGVVVGSVLFAVINTVISNLGPFKSFANLFPGQLASNVLQFGPALIGALLLLLTLAFNPGGLAQQLAPIVRWMSGGRFRSEVAEPDQGASHAGA
ncbi:MAG TPA: branched-chain amino acid ABC transporter permease [Mycobacteriales bacterium]|nr:branched-chain amino acid ABC transporter permease [Mycobacteriales bacterium]